MVVFVLQSAVQTESPSVNATAQNTKPSDHKLGRLWAWNDQGSAPVYKALAMNEVRETKAIVLYSHSHWGRALPNGVPVLGCT